MKSFKSKLSKLVRLSLIAVIALAVTPTLGWALCLGSGLYVAGNMLKQGMAFNGHICLSTIDPTDLTFEGKQAMSINEGIYEKVYAKSKLSDIHQIQTGIKAKTQIPFLGRLGLVGKKKSACDTTANTGQIPMSEKFWEPQWITDRFEECWDTLKETFFVWGLANGIKKEDLTDTDFANFLEDRISDAVLEAIYRIAHFGDTVEDTVGNGGNLVNGTDKTYFNMLDGMWPQLIEIAGTLDTDRRVTISKNAQASYANQKFNSTDTTNKVAEDIFDQLLYNADYRLRDAEGLRIYVTQSLADQYARELRSRNLDASYVRIEGGYKALMFEGIPVIPINSWDRTIKSYFHNGTKWYLPHRAVLTVKENIPIGTEDEGSLAELKPGYYEYGKKYFVDFGFMLDMKVLEPYMVQVAY